MTGRRERGIKPNKENAIMKKCFVLFAILVAAGCGGSEGKVLVDIGGTEITEGDLKFLGEVNPRLQSQITNPAGQKRLLDNLVEQELLYQEAVKKGVNRDPKVKEKVNLYRKVIVAQSLIDAETEKATKKYYDEHQEEFKKLKLSHIMVKFATPDEIKKAKKGEKARGEEDALKAAQDIKAKIDAGEEFAKLAKELSEDPITKTSGGDLGLASKDDNRLKGRGFGPLIEKAFELKVGEVSGPIKTDKGYHIITVTQGLELEPFDNAKQTILFKTRDLARQELLGRLKKEVKVVYPEEEKQKAQAKKAEEAKKAQEVAKEAAKPEASQEGEVKPEPETKPVPEPAPKVEKKEVKTEKKK